MKLFVATLLLLGSLASTGAGQSSASPDPQKPLAFLIGTWYANAKGDAGVTSIGTYTFRTELGGHVLARHSATNASTCKGPADFDCDHSDLLYLYAEGQALKAIYFDNEGHTIHYDVTTPTPTSVQFLSEPGTPGPRFRLLYELKESNLSGKFQIQMPGQTEWHSYLEWSGARKQGVWTNHDSTATPDDGLTLHIP